MENGKFKTFLIFSFLFSVLFSSSFLFIFHFPFSTFHSLQVLIFVNNRLLFVTVHFYSFYKYEK